MVIIASPPAFSSTQMISCASVRKVTLKTISSLGRCHTLILFQEMSFSCSHSVGGACWAVSSNLAGEEGICSHMETKSHRSRIRQVFLNQSKFFILQKETNDELNIAATELAWAYLTNTLVLLRKKWGKFC